MDIHRTEWCGYQTGCSQDINRILEQLQLSNRLVSPAILDRAVALAAIGFPAGQENGAKQEVTCGGKDGRERGKIGRVERQRDGERKGQRMNSGNEKKRRG